MMGTFDKMMNQLGQLNGQSVAMTLEPDSEGYFDRQCPATDCQFRFKVLLSDWKTLFKDEQVYCPQCRHESTADNWFTVEQREQVFGQLRNYVRGHVATALQKAAVEANRQWPSDSWLKMTVSVKGPIAKHVFVPISAQDAFTLKVECNQCTAHYAVIGSAFFCPNCGHNSAEQTFGNTLRKVGAKLDNIELVREAFTKSGQLDEGQLVALSLVETALSDCVSALQRLCEELFRRHFPNETAPFNIFQRIEPASELWRRKIGAGYEDWLSDAQLQDMKMLYQRRHLLAHSEGMVDDKYLQKSQDNSYKAGQRIVVKEKDVRALIDYVSTIANGLKGAIASV
jgi:RNA polymerase subunit RPABC4/transcription elongation factor Spt4